MYAENQIVGAEIYIMSLVEGKSTSGTLVKLKCDEGTRKRRIAVLGSGKGTNLAAILEAEASGALGAEVVLVISDVKDSGILKLAGERGVFVDPGEHAKRFSAAAQKEVRDRLLAADVEPVTATPHVSAMASSHRSLGGGTARVVKT